MVIQQYNRRSTMQLTTVANLIQKNLSSMEKDWDGKECIAFLKEESERCGINYGWRQMEWIGFYFEHKAFTLLQNELGGSIGPKYGNVVLDYTFNGVWDFKAHPTNSGSEWVYLNDVEAIDLCLQEHGHLAWVIACGEAKYDGSGEFKAWHDSLKGKTSQFVLDRIKRGAPSRRRKVAFNFENIDIIEFRNQTEIKNAINQGWLRKDMQKDQRNSGGTQRRAKYGINLELWKQHN